VETFNNSAAAALAALGRLKQYPEAEYWIGEIYRVEGESGLALAQYRKAYELRGLFENGDFDTELLYTIADIHKIRQEYNEMERTLLLIVQGSLWSDSTTAEDAVPAAMPPAAPVPGQPVPHAEASASFARQAMTRTLEVDGPGRFLAMYRYNNTRVEKAHRLLGFYYAASGRHSRAQEHLMFAFLIQNTVIIEELIRQRYDFSFTDLADLTDWAGRYSLLSAYMEDAQYYKTAYYLGTSLYGNGKALSAGSLWTFLGARSEAGEWQQYAQRQLRNPRVELAVEMP
jgi:tetratricopeptide (TPR) repeat protein